MTQSDMWERVCNLERANRLIFKDFNKKVSDQHNDCLRRIGDVENHYEVYCEGLSMKMEQQSRSVTAKMSKMSKALEDAQASIDNINTVLLKVAPDVVEQVIFDRLRADGEASPSRLCIPRVPVCRFAAVAGGLHSCTDYCLRLTNPAKYYTCPCGIRQTGTPCVATAWVRLRRRRVRVRVRLRRRRACASTREAAIGNTTTEYHCCCHRESRSCHR